MKRLHRLSLYQVESIQGRKIDERGLYFYLIKWMGWEERFNTWQPLSNLSNVKNLIQNYENSIEKPNQGIEVSNQNQKKGEEIQKKERKVKSHKKEKKIEEAAQKKQEQGQEIQQKQDVKPSIEGQQRSIKKSRGRPKKIRTNNFCGEQQKSDNKKRKQKIPNVPKDESSLKDLNLIKEKLSIIAEQKSENEKLTPKAEPPKKRKYISKPRPKPQRAEQRLVKQQEQSKQRQQRNEPFVVLPLPSTEQGVYDEHVDDNQSQGIQHVLLKCKNYQRVKVTFKEGSFSYEIPYISEGKEKSIILTTDEIIKVNPRWFQGYFQGFFL